MYKVCGLGRACGRAAAAAALFFGVLGGRAASEPVVRLTLEGEPTAVFLWASDRCDREDNPDTSARAIRAADGTVRLYASHSVNRVMSGPDLESVRHDCTIAHEGAGADDPSAFDDKAWLSGLYTLDGINVFALIHNEFQGNKRPPLCPSRKYMHCWRNSITFAVSHDAGRSFMAPERPSNLVATPPRQYETDLGRHVGYFNPTNIVERDGFYYAFFSASSYGAQKPGKCLMRTDRLADPTSWRGWDGSSFNVRFVNPYLGTVEREANHVCAPVGAGRLLASLGSIVRHTTSGMYIMVMAGAWQRNAQEERAEGVYISTSYDLISWSHPQLVWRTPTHPSPGLCGPLVNYTSLIDPASASRSFETIGDTAYLYFVEQIQQNCRIGPERNLFRRSVRIKVVPD